MTKPIDLGTAETSPHYNKLGKQQPILVMLRELTHEEFRGFLKGNHIKYTQRAGLKEGTNDQAKADQYLKWLNEHDAFRCISIGNSTYTKESA
jgi:hypothetical protein